ncbi:MAG: hypothetical protein IJ067_09815 [Prevotella sp.]|nr:hypothetical protein [Prevotella sp.]
MSIRGYAKEKADSLILYRIYEYQRALNKDISDIEDHVYAKFRFNVEKRNATLWLIPTMYVLAKDPREYIRESYNKVHFEDSHHYDINSQVLAGTIRRNRQAMPTLLDYMTPNIYDIDLYDGHILSPFNRINRHYYRYKQKHLNDGTTRLDFRPKLYNTQLLNGYAIVETETGRIIRTVLNGEFDMITFRTEILQGNEGPLSLMPKRCTTVGTFRFVGNRISALFDATYHCQKTLADSITKVSSRELMDSIRPVPLTETDKRIYEEYDLRHVPDSTGQDTVPKKTNLLKKVLWDTIGDQLVTPIAAETDVAEFYLSPIINPLYLRYSKSRGFSYKMRLNARYTFSPHRYLTFKPTFGYNFKQRQFYFTAPLRMTYNPKRNGYAEIVWGNGNRISNYTVMDQINHEHQDTLDIEDLDMDKFKDNHLQVFNNIMLFDWLDIESGIVFHQRLAVKKDLMRQYGMPTEYRSFAPMIGLKFSPWLNRGPVFSIDWERSFKNVFDSNIAYERWEFDAQWKYRIPGLRVLNLRSGLGFYSDKHDNYFLDFTNFRDNNLPEGWDDNWSGDFQLLRSRVYNESDYYIRGNISYESPLLFAKWVPYLGKYIEKERLYVSAVILDHTRPYTEIGYGFTNRYLSVGLFASFMNRHFQRFGVSFDFELFKRW